MFPDLTRFDRFAYDTETTGLNPMAGDKVFGFSVSTPDGKDYYWDIRTNPKAAEWINHQFANLGDTKVVCHNLSFDYRMSHATGIYMPIGNCHDTVIYACLINEHEHSYSLDYLSRKYLRVQKKGDDLYKDMAKIFGGRATKNVQMKRIADAPEYIVAPYAKADTRATLELFDWQMKEVERQDLQRIVDFERRVTPVIIASEMRGVRVDVERAQQAVVHMCEPINHLQRQLNDIAGFQCNPQPSKDIQKLFNPTWRDGRWWAVDGTPLESTESGNPQLDAATLRNMSHPASKVILELRSLIKTRDTFLTGHILESAVNGRVYPSINQTKGESAGTGTGRLSYTSPALQQIPDRNKEVAKIVKPIFLPEEGHLWVDADMASFEVRMFAHLIGTPDIVQAYKNNPETDFHQFVADLTGLPRNATYSGQPNAKQLNLSMIFNQGNGTTAETMGMPWTWESFTPKGDTREVVYKKAGAEAMEIINKYHSALTGVKALADGCKAKAESRGYIFTRCGRHLRFPNGFKSYKASGLLIQSTSADENKMNWLRINEALEGTGGVMLLNTHDSYSLSLPEDQANEIARKVKKVVEEDRGLLVPLILEVQNAGKNWWESKSSERML